MKKLYSLIVLILIVSFCSFGCSATMNYVQLDEVRPAKETNAPIAIYYVQQKVPARFKVVGKIKIGDSGFSVSCGYETVIEKAKAKAREVGADAIQLLEIKTPDFWSTCYRITANALVSEE